MFSVLLQYKKEIGAILRNTYGISISDVAGGAMDINEA